MKLSFVVLVTAFFAGSAHALTTAHLEERGTACSGAYANCLHACGTVSCDSGDCHQYCKCAYCWNTNPIFDFPCVSNLNCVPPNF
ncbi:hypothetical protein C8Q76DRAFT_803510 [Earliella scabrosa]|nr:hypothetical protein C8Q76DRAFT_803510 [Earliella scabrosa]